MPTGYTAYIEDGDIATGKDFLMLCSRAFGVAVGVRDEPLSVPTPTHFEPDPYYKRRYEGSVKELQDIKDMSFEEAKTRMRAEHDSKVDYAKRQIKKMEEINRKYENVRCQVEAWVPPSEDHNGIKKFALEQIDMCIYSPMMLDAYRDDITSELDESDDAVRKYMDELISFSVDDVARAKERYEEEIKRVENRNQFMKLFVDSLEDLERGGNHIRSKD